MMGEAYGRVSPVKTFVDTLYLEAYMPAGETLLLPDTEQLAIYVAAGELLVGEQKLPQYSMVILEDNTTGFSLQSKTESRIALIGGAKMSPRFIEWNFVSSRKERIAQAKDDWQAGRFPKVVDDELEFIPLP